MRTSILSRSVIAVATVALGSGVLASASAGAATPSGITREQVLTAANGLRSTSPTPEAQAATTAAITAMVTANCAVNTAAGEQVLFAFGDPVQPGGNADGLDVFAIILGSPSYRACTFGVAATTDPAFALSGTATLTVNSTDTPGATEVPTVVTSAMSGDVFATAPVNTPSNRVVTSGSFVAAGNATRTTSVTTTKRVVTKKTKAQKKAAKKKYDKRIKAAKKSYAKALDRAGSSKVRKAAAKKSYSAKRASAKAKYRRSVAGSKLVKVTSPKTENRPFSISSTLFAFDN